MPLRDPHSAQTELVPPQSPIPPRESTPRPSISPLSAKASPVTIKDSAMQELDIDAASADPGDNEDARSSSLSEPDDDYDGLQKDDGKSLNAPTQEQLVHQSLEADSEAETERLDQTPRSRNRADNPGRTPSKLSHGATADGDLSDPPSPIPVVSGSDAISSMSIFESVKTDCGALTYQVPVDTDHMTDKKRKRSDTADSSLSSADSDAGESPRKRSHSSAEDDTAIRLGSNRDGIEEVPSVAEARAEDQGLTVDARDTVIISLSRPGRGRKPGKQKGKPKKEAPKDVEQEKPAVTELPEEELSAEAVAKSAEELQHKNTASAVFEDLAKQFTAFREKMYSEKLAALSAELELLNQPDCKHPEYLRQVACVDARLQKQASETRAFYKFKLDSLRRTTLGERSQLHSQYFQHARELRENTMYQLGEDWYSIQRERRQNHQEKGDAYIYKFPTKRSVQIRQQAKYNQEVSVLSGVAKYVGFPAAPEITGAEGDSLEDDLKAMKISKRAQQANTHQQPVYIPNRSGLLQGRSDRIAHEQFIEQNPWARPQGQFQNHGTPNLTHTPDWAEPGAYSAKNFIRNINGGILGAASPYTTPMPQRRAPLEHSSSEMAPANNDGPDQPSSVIAAPPTDRMQHAQLGRDQGSPLAVTKHRQNGRELTGFRDISNLSGTSTIDAPPDSAEKERELPSISREMTAPQHILDTSQLAGNGPEARRQHDVFSNPLFRLQEGAFGTPAPLPAPSGKT